MKSLIFNKRRLAVHAILIPALALSFAACDDDDPMEPAAPQDIVDIAAATPQVSTLVSALTAAGLTGALEAEGPFTVFAPVNEGFTALGDDVVNSLLEPANAALLTSILTFHVIPGANVFSGDLTDGQTVTTLQGETLTIGVSGSSVTVNGATVVTPDVEASNGVIHLIDAVLVPEVDIVDVAVLNGFSTLVDLVREAGLESTLRSDNNGDGFTVFAPTNEAFAALASVPSGQALIDVLTYHVVGATVGSSSLSDGQIVATVEGSAVTVGISGSDVTLTDAAANTVSVTLTDVAASNGVVHVIDGVILPS